MLATEVVLANVNTTEDAKAAFSRAFPHEAVITNLGVVDIPQKFGPPVLDAVWGPLVSSAMVGDQVVGVATFNEQLHLVHTSFSAIFGLLDQMAAEITAALTNAVH